MARHPVLRCLIYRLVIWIIRWFCSAKTGSQCDHRQILFLIWFWSILDLISSCSSSNRCSQIPPWAKWPTYCQLVRVAMRSALWSLALSPTMWTIRSASCSHWQSQRPPSPLCLTSSHSRWCWQSSSSPVSRLVALIQVLIHFFVWSNSVFY